jgi:hypothetical protein
MATLKGATSRMCWMSAAQLRSGPSSGRFSRPLQPATSFPRSGCISMVHKVCALIEPIAQKNKVRVYGF